MVDEDHKDSSRLSLGDIDQRYAEIRLLPATEVCRRVRDDNLKRGANLSFEKMSAPRRTVGKTQNHMHVKARLSVVADRDITDRAQHLALLRDLDLFIGLLLEVEPANGRPFEGADGRERRRSDTGIVGDLVSVAKASSPDSRIATRVSEPASPDNLALFIDFKPRFAGCVDLP
ncbi:hypothetical protein M2171_001225 [Bradyrhizobium japonicum USDA 38]|nr:hypothetical protein [Bradyrhizobium japonicum USDA 38]MCS3944606.1 hypothetical protein [Bradyrhizobium japonicum]